MSDSVLLKRGDSGPKVAQAQQILLREGYGLLGDDLIIDNRLVASGIFDEPTLYALIHFQETHIDGNGDFLDVDGDIGPKTWWALNHPHGDAQRSGYSAVIPDGISGVRRAIVEAGLADHAIGVREVPDGSNWGDGVVKYGGRPGWAWCCLATSYWTLQGAGKYVLGEKIAACRLAWDKGYAMKIVKRGNPCPGDQGIMLYRDSRGNLTGRGHTFIVIGVSEDCKSVFTVGGNEGNRVKIGKRPVSQIHGYIVLAGDIGSEPEFQRGTVTKATGTAGDSTR